MNRNIDDMNDREVIDYLIEMCEGYAVYMKHVRRYYPDIHNKTVLTKTFREANKDL